MSSNSFIHHMVTLPACSWPVNDFSCSDAVVFSQSKSIIIILNSLQKSLLSLENVQATRNKKVRERSVSVLDSYLHFEFCGVENFHAQRNFTGVIVPVQLKVWQRRVPQKYCPLPHFYFCQCLKLVIIPLKAWICICWCYLSWISISFGRDYVCKHCLIFWL